MDQVKTLLKSERTVPGEFSVDQANALPSVDVVYSYAAAPRDMVDAHVSAGTKGVILAGVGGGNSTDTVVAGLGDAAKTARPEFIRFNEVKVLSDHCYESSNEAESS